MRRSGRCGWRGGFRRIFASLFFGCEALGHDGGVETLAELVGDLVDLLALVNLDGLLGRVQDNAAVLASGGVGADFVEETWTEFLVKVIGEMDQKVGAVHAVS